MKAEIMKDQEVQKRTQKIFYMFEQNSGEQAYDKGDPNDSFRIKHFQSADIRKMKLVPEKKLSPDEEVID